LNNKNITEYNTTFYIQICFEQLLNDFRNQYRNNDDYGNNFFVNIHEKDVYEFTLKMQSQLIISSINLYNKDLTIPTTSLYQKQIH